MSKQTDKQECIEASREDPKQEAAPWGSPPGSVVFYLDHQGQVRDYQADPQLPLCPPDKLPCSLNQFLSVPSQTLFAALAQPGTQLLDVNLRHRQGGRLACRGWLEAEEDHLRLQLFDLSDLRQQLSAQETRLRWLTQSHEILERLLYVRLDELEVESERLLADICRTFQLPAAAIFIQNTLTQKLDVLHAYARELPTPIWFDAKEFSRLQRTSNHRVTQEYFSVEHRYPDRPDLYLVLAWPQAQEWRYTLKERGAALAKLWLSVLQQRLFERSLQQSALSSRILREHLSLNWCEFFPEQALFLVEACRSDPLEALHLANPMPMHVWWQWILPAQREAFELEWQDALSQQKRLDFHLTLNLEGRSIDYALTLSWLPSSQGQRGVGYLRNIDQETQLHREASQIRQRMASLLETTPALIYVQSYELGALTLSYCNAGSDQLLGWSEESFCQQGFLALLHPEDRDLYAQRNQQLFQMGKASSRWRMRDAEGVWHHLLDEARLVRDALGVPVEVVAIALDVTDLHKAEESARHYHELSIRDPLTGVNNPRFLQQQLQVELARAQRSGEVFSLCLLDLDKFKSVNDTYGHLIGDEVLVGFARIIMESLRLQDLAFRYGGEEFVLLLPNTVQADACLVAERLRETLEQSAVSATLPDLRVTVSIGISEFRTDDTALTLMERADNALYEAKESGRNQVKLSV